MSDHLPPSEQVSFAADDFFYFFMQVRKPRIHAVVHRLRKLCPDDTPEQHARRLIESHSQLSFVAGCLLHVPLILPGVGAVLKLLGLTAGVAVISRVHLYLILEIATLYGKDLDDRARVPEMVAIIAATGAAVAATPIVLSALDIAPIIAIPAAGLTATALTRLTGKMAIRHYSARPAIGPATAQLPAPSAAPA